MSAEGAAREIRCREFAAYGAPLAAGSRPLPEPRGREALVRVRNCGVCHSDIHIHDGHFALGGGKRLDISSGRPLPFTPGHEVEGEVAALGPDADGAGVGDRVVVYPWIGCGGCATCARGDEHMCNRPRNIGVNLHGGYADHCLVPDSKYLFGYGSVDPALAATYACSGITAYGALAKLAPPAEDDAVMIVGMGGVGMAALAFARALFPSAPPLAADIDPAKRRAALAAGAAEAFDSADPAAAKAVRKATGGGCAGVVDFVGSEASFGFADAVARKGGRIVVVGLIGGRMSMPLPMFPLRALTVSGSLVGSPAQFADMMALVRAGRVSPTPVRRRPLAEANSVLDALRAGEIVGRAVLAPE